MCKLSECVEILDAQRIPVSSAVRKKQKEKKYPYYGAQGVIDYVDNYLFDGEYILVAEDGNNLKALNESIVTWAVGKIWVNNHAHILGAKEGYNLKYIYYLLRVMDLRGYITGSDQPKLSQENLAKIELELPEKEEQDKIAKSLAFLDEKIENNNIIWDNLSNILKLYYQYWFVQYEFPNEDGRPYKKNNGIMKWDNDISKEIPEDWTVKSLTDIASISANTVNPVKGEIYSHYSIPAYDDDSVPVLEDGEAIASNKYEVPSESILISKLNPQFKRLWPVGGGSGICSTEFLPITTDGNDMSYIYCVLDSDEAYTYMVNSASSSTGSRKRIQPDVLMNFKVAVPNNKMIIKKFVSITEPLLKYMVEIKKENHILRTKREKLTPYFMIQKIMVE